MRKSTREMLIVLIVVALIGGLIIFFGWATDWFTSWNRFKFRFGSAGQKVQETFADNDEAVTKAAANGGIYHDSEFGEATINIVQHAEPKFGFIDGEDGNKVLAFDKNGAEVEFVRLCVVTPGWGWNSAFCHDLYYNESGMCYRTVKDFVTACELQYDMVYEMQACHMASGAYMDSEIYRDYIYIPAEDKIDSKAVFDGTKVVIDMPYPYEYRDPGNGASQTHNTLGIKIYAESDTGKVDSVGLNVSTPEGASSNNYWYDYDVDLADSPFSLTTGDNSKITIDLTKLPFISTRYGTCVIEIRELYSYSWYGAMALSNLPDAIYFDNSKLAPPTDISFADGMLFWSYEGEAPFGFGVFDGDSALETTTEKSLDLRQYSLTSGEHTFRIRALGNVGAALASENVMLMTAYNASSNITPCVVLTYDIEGDTVTKFVPRGKALENYLYDVEVDGKVFGGWYYDSGYSLTVETGDTLDKDTTIYARLSDLPVEPEAPVKTSWWDRNMWYVLGPIFAGLGLAVIAVTVKVIRDKKKGR